MAIKKRILITGVSGFLGSNLGFCWKDQCDVLGLFNRRPVRLQGIRTKQVDLFADGAMRQTVLDFRPDAIIHCAALASIDACQENNALARQMNVDMVIRVVDALGKSHAKLVYISTDSVYDGSTGDHKEEEGINPANYYGHTKYLGELQALEYPGTLIVRTAFFGRNIGDKLSFAQEVVSKLSARQRIAGLRDVFTSMIYTFDLADLLMKALGRDLQGVYNFGSSTSMAKYDFAVSLAKIFKLDSSLIEPTSVDNFNFKAMRGKNLSMNVAKLSGSLKEEIPSLKEGIKHFYDDFKHKIPKF